MTEDIYWSHKKYWKYHHLLVDKTIRLYVSNDEAGGAFVRISLLGDDNSQLFGWSFPQPEHLK